MFEDHKQERHIQDTNKRRFRIEKLEERIAPAKGGIPGPPDGNGGGSDGPHGPCYSPHPRSTCR